MEHEQPGEPQPEPDRSSGSPTRRARRKSSFAAAAAKKLQTQTKQREDAAAVPSTASDNVDAPDPQPEAMVRQAPQTPQRSSESTTGTTPRPRRKSSFAAAAAKKHMAAQQANVDSLRQSDATDQSVEISESPREPDEAVEDTREESGRETSSTSNVDVPLKNRTTTRRASIKQLLQHHNQSETVSIPINDSSGLEIEQEQDSLSEANEVYDTAEGTNVASADDDNKLNKSNSIIQRASAFKAKDVSQSRRGSGIKERSSAASEKIATADGDIGSGFAQPSSAANFFETGPFDFAPDEGGQDVAIEMRDMADEHLEGVADDAMGAAGPDIETPPPIGLLIGLVVLAFQKLGTVLSVPSVSTTFPAAWYRWASKLTAFNLDLEVIMPNAPNIREWQFFGALTAAPIGIGLFLTSARLEKTPFPSKSELETLRQLSPHGALAAAWGLMLLAPVLAAVALWLAVEVVLIGFLVAVVVTSIALYRVFCDSEQPKEEHAKQIVSQPAISTFPEALKFLDRSHFGEALGQQKPPGGVDSVFEAFACLLGEYANFQADEQGRVIDRSWGGIKTRLLTTDQDLIVILEKWCDDAENGRVPEVNFTEAASYVKVDYFNPEVIMSKSVAAVGCCKFVCAVVELHTHRKSFPSGQDRTYGDALTHINPADWTELMNQNAPPDPIIQVVAALACLTVKREKGNFFVDEKGKIIEKGWAAMKLGFGKEDVHGMLQEWCDDAENGRVPAVNFAEAASYVKLEDFTPEKMKKCSSAAQGVCMFIHAAVEIQAKKNLPTSKYNRTGCVCTIDRSWWADYPTWSKTRQRVWEALKWAAGSVLLASRETELLHILLPLDVLLEVSRRGFDGSSAASPKRRGRLLDEHIALQCAKPRTRFELVIFIATGVPLSILGVPLRVWSALLNQHVWSLLFVESWDRRHAKFMLPSFEVQVRREKTSMLETGIVTSFNMDVNLLKVLGWRKDLLEREHILKRDSTGVDIRFKLDGRIRERVPLSRVSPNTYISTRMLLAVLLIVPSIALALLGIFFKMGFFFAYAQLHFGLGLCYIVSVILKRGALKGEERFAADTTSARQQFWVTIPPLEQGFAVWLGLVSYMGGVNAISKEGLTGRGALRWVAVALSPFYILGPLVLLILGGRHFKTTLERKFMNEGHGVVVNAGPERRKRGRIEKKLGERAYMVNFEGQDRGVFNGHTKPIVKSQLDLDWTPDDSAVQGELEKERLSFKKTLMCDRVRDCDVRGPNREGVEQKLACQAYAEERSQISFADFVMFVDGFEYWAWWYRAAMLVEGALITIVTQVFAESPPSELFGAVLAVSFVSTLGSVWSAPFLDDIADTVDVWMRLQNLLIFGVGMVQALPDSITPGFASSACSVLLAGISAFTGARFLMGLRPKELLESFIETARTARAASLVARFTPSFVENMPAEAVKLLPLQAMASLSAAQAELFSCHHSHAMTSDQLMLPPLAEARIRRSRRVRSAAGQGDWHTFTKLLIEGNVDFSWAGAGDEGPDSSSTLATPILHVAVRTGRAEFVQLFLQEAMHMDWAFNSNSGFDVDQIDPCTGRTALGEAAACNRTAAMRVLLQFGSNANHACEAGSVFQTKFPAGTLHYVPLSSIPSSNDVIPGVGTIAHIYKTTKTRALGRDQGITPLHFAAFNGNITAVSLLLHMGGADATIRSDQESWAIGASPRELAELCSHTHIAELLTAADPGTSRRAPSSALLIHGNDIEFPLDTIEFAFEDDPEFPAVRGTGNVQDLTITAQNGFVAPIPSGHSKLLSHRPVDLSEGGPSEIFMLKRSVDASELRVFGPKQEKPELIVEAFEHDDELHGAFERDEPLSKQDELHAQRLIHEKPKRQTSYWRRRNVGRHDGSGTQAGSGTPSYMRPTSASKQKQVDAKAPPLGSGLLLPSPMFPIVIPAKIHHDEILLEKRALHVEEKSIC